MGVGHVPQEPLRPEGADSQFQGRERGGASSRRTGRSGSGLKPTSATTTSPDVSLRDVSSNVVSSRAALGQLGEDLVVRWYEEQGYVIVARNWRRRRGEIDVIARGDHVLVICEVKTRSSQYFGEPSLAVGREKQQRLRRLAGEWLSENPWRDVVRFDVAEVIIDARGTPPMVRVIESAF